MSRILTQLVALVIALVLLTPVTEASGIFSFEQTPPSVSQPQSNCVGGVCPLPSRSQVPKTTVTVGPATCVAIGQNQKGWTFALTAGHNIGPKESGIQYFVIGADERKHQAFPFFVDMKNDIAGVLVRSRLKTAVVADRPPVVGETVTVQGLLTRRFEESRGRVSSSQRFVLRISDVWAHPGMSGGCVKTSRGVVGIFYGTMKEKVGLATGYQCLIDGVASFEERFGKLTFRQRETLVIQDIAISDVMRAPYIEGVSPPGSKPTEAQLKADKKKSSALSSIVKQLESTRREHTASRTENTQLRASLNALQITINNLKTDNDESQPPPLPREEARPPNNPERFVDPPIIPIPQRSDANAEVAGPGLWGQWGSFVKGAAFLLAPQYVVPITAGLSVLGFGVRYYRKRRQGVPRTEAFRESRSDVVSRPTLTNDGKTTEQTLWRDGVRLALGGQLPVLGSKLVGKAIEDYVYTRGAKQHGDHIQRG